MRLVRSLVLDAIHQFAWWEHIWVRVLRILISVIRLYYQEVIMTCICGTSHTLPHQGTHLFDCRPLDGCKRPGQDEILKFLISTLLLLQLKSKPDQPSFLQMAKSVIGKDINQPIPMPVEMCEPSVDLMKRAEDIEYSDLLNEVRTDCYWLHDCLHDLAIHMGIQL